MVTYNHEERQFEENGVAVEAAVMAVLIARLMDTAKREVRRLSIQLERGKITVEQWSESVVRTLRAAHITAAAIGRGGIDRMTGDDWQRVERTVRHQTGYLEKFRDAIVIGTTALAGGLIARRAIKYIAPVHTSFSLTVQAAQTENRIGPVFARRITTAAESCEECIAYAYEWMPVDDLPEIGSLICGHYCHCFVEYR